MLVGLPARTKYEVSEAPSLQYTGFRSERWWKMRMSSTALTEGRTRHFIPDRCSRRTRRGRKPVFPCSTWWQNNPTRTKGRRPRGVTGHVDLSVRSGCVEHIVSTRRTVGICKHTIWVVINGLPPKVHICICSQRLIYKQERSLLTDLFASLKIYTFSRKYKRYYVFISVNVFISTLQWRHSRVYKYSVQILLPNVFEWKIAFHETTSLQLILTSISRDDQYDHC